MRALLLLCLALVALPLSGCSGRQYLFVTLDSKAPLVFAAADVTVENAGRTGTAHYDHGARIPPVATAVLHFDEDHSGEATVTFVVRDPSGNELARGSDKVVLTPHERTDVFITLGEASSVGADGGAGSDAGDAGSDGGVGDMAMPDLAPAVDMTPVLGFAPVLSVPVGTDGLEKIFVEDADRDGIVDILVSTRVNQKTQLATLRGTMYGGYRAPIFQLTDYQYAGLFMVDLNGDGVNELFAFDQLSPAGTLYRARGDGIYTLVSRPDVDIGFRDFVAADFNGDKKLDAVALQASPSPNTFRFWPGDGAGSLGLSRDSGGKYPGEGPLAMDVDRDGRMDIVSFSGELRTMYVSLGNGDGTFKLPVSTRPPSPPAEVHAGDFNGDGIVDVLIRPCGNDTLCVLLGRGDGTFNAPIASKGPAYLLSVVRDLDLDGKPDIAGFYPMLQNVVVWLGKGDGTFGRSFVIPGTAAMVAIEGGDIDKDGDIDLLVSDSKSQSVGIFRNTYR